MRKLKYKIVSELLDETMREVSSSEENWCRFLTTSSRLYKYPFKEQVLIYAQRPDATACASVEIWNHRMNCWINRGSKGIVLIDEDRYGKLKYVFDVSDVHKGRWRDRLPYLWDMKEVHQEPVLKRLEELYGKTDEIATFVDRIRVIADRITEETGKQLFHDVEELKKGSRLEYLDDANLKLRLQLTLSDSVAYSILKRCGISDEVLENTIGFMYIPEFNTTDTLLLLGNHVSELAKPVLMEICKCIWKFDYLCGRNVVRQGIVTIAVSFSVTAKWLKALTAYSKRDKLSVYYFDTETAELKNTEMYVDGFKAKLEKDTSYRGLWTVTFTLKEF